MESEFWKILELKFKEEQHIYNCIYYLSSHIFYLDLCHKDGS
jgi:hypothetical protein